MKRLVRDRTTDDLKAEVLDSFMRLTGAPPSAAEETLEAVRAGYNDCELHALLQILVASAQDAELKPSHVLVFLDIGTRLLSCHNGCSLIESMAGIIAQRRAMVAGATAKRRAQSAKGN